MATSVSDSASQSFKMIELSKIKINLNGKGSRILIDYDYIGISKCKSINKAISFCDNFVVLKRTVLFRQ